MNHLFSRRSFRNIALFVFFASYVLYLGILNRYHLAYLEQNQLFRYHWRYVTEFLTRPGGLLELAGAFFTQFLVWTPLSACIVALPGILVFFLSRNIFRQYAIGGMLFSLIPVVFLAGLQNNFNFQFTDTLGWLFALLFVFLYSRIRSGALRYLAGTAGWIALYLALGFYSFPALFYCIIHEVVIQKGRPQAAYVLALFILPLCIPWLAWRYLYYLPFTEIVLYPASHIIQTEVFLLLLLLYYPLLMLISVSLPINLRQKIMSLAADSRYPIAGIVFLLFTGYFVHRYSYEYKNELFLEMDSRFQKKQWKEVLKVAQAYPGNNQLVMYYTNLALYNSGQLADKFFSYPQAGTGGLWLPWKRNETTPFYGSEIFYELGYNNEAIRWTFEAMEVKGPNPRSLKRLVVNHIINKENAIAAKYLTVLDKSLFYRSWAKHYREYLTHPDQLQRNTEITEKRHFLIHKDFVADISDHDLGFMKLLENHPDNRMAYEYWMITLLVKKDLNTFANNVFRMKELGYARIPGHFEEAILLYNKINKRNILPEGYQISAQTMKRFHQYAATFASNRQSIGMAANALKKSFGHTFWYHMQFSDYTNPSNQTHP
jgi:hypothetical protein